MSAASTGPVDILTALREYKDAAVSGEALSTRLGVSRAQVWKHVGTLRKR
jgi:biotin operon repressor